MLDDEHAWSALQLRASKAYLRSHLMVFHFGLVLTSLLSSTYNKVLQLVRMNSTPEPLAEIPLQTPHLINYSERIFAEYARFGEQRARAWHVRELRLNKTKALSRHEYLAAQVVSGEGKPFWIALERTRGEVVDKKEEVEKLSEHGSNEDIEGGLGGGSPAVGGISLARSWTGVQDALASSSSVLDSLDKLFASHEADDRVSILDNSGKHNGDDDTFQTFFFPPPSSDEKPLYLYELVVFATVTHRLNPKYLLMSNNCYFFAGTVMKVIKDMYNPRLEFVTTGSEESDKKAFREGAGKGNIGHWNRIPIYPDERIDVGTVRGLFENGLKQYHSRVGSA